MNVLFVCSGNSKNGISPITLNQGNSLVARGINIQYFTIKGKGLVNYLKAIYQLRKYLKINHFDIIHAHYSLSGFVAGLSTGSPVITSLMGSDIQGNRLSRVLINLFAHFRWKKVIVKSARMKIQMKLKEAIVIPNGVDLELFKPIGKIIAQEKVNFNPDNINIVFIADPARKEKNFTLALTAVNLIGNPDIILYPVYNVNHELIPYYLNAADLLLLSSLWEGSPNVVKEAMACNCPIVTTDVGDVRTLIENLKGCFICNFESGDVAKNIERAILFGSRTEGRKTLIGNELDSDSIAKKIIDLYQKTLK